MALVAHATPNPAALRFDLHQEWVAEPLDLGPDEAAHHPIAEALFGLPGIERLLLTPSFVTVTADAWTPGLEELVGVVLEEVVQTLSPRIGRARDVVRDGPPTVEDKVEALLDWEVRPYVASHGGDVQLVEVIDGVVRLVLRGACHACPSATLTLAQGIEARLLLSLPELERVEAVPG